MDYKKQGHQNLHNCRCYQVAPSTPASGEGGDSFITKTKTTRFIHIRAISFAAEQGTLNHATVKAVTVRKKKTSALTTSISAPLMQRSNTFFSDCTFCLKAKEWMKFPWNINSTHISIFRRLWYWTYTCLRASLWCLTKKYLTLCKGEREKRHRWRSRSLFW